VGEGLKKVSNWPYSICSMVAISARIRWRADAGEEAGGGFMAIGSMFLDT
jgi:hypothetical protein